MKNRIFLILLTVFIAGATNAQNSRFSIKTLYGLSASNFAQQYDENGGPANKTYLYDKNVIGTIGGIELHYRLGLHSSIGIGYARGCNAGKKNYQNTVGTTDLSIRDFTIRDFSNFYQLQYHYRFGKTSSGWELGTGLFMFYPSQQTITIENWDNYISMEERNYKNGRLEEAGVFASISYTKKIDTHFELGIQAKVYYVATLLALHNVSLTPTLSYRF